MSYTPVVWEEILPGEDGSLVSDLLDVQYEFVDEKGRWPQSYDEVVLIVNENNEISDFVLYALGLKSYEEMEKNIKSAFLKEPIDTDNLGKWSYDEIYNKTFKLVLTPDMYQKQADGDRKSVGRERVC